MAGRQRNLIIEVSDTTDDTTTSNSLLNKK